jgi:hypothetical protein
MLSTLLCYNDTFCTSAYELYDPEKVSYDKFSFGAMREIAGATTFPPLVVLYPFFPYYGNRYCTIF